MKAVYVRMPDDLHRTIRHVAADDDVSVNKCLLSLIEEALEERRASLPNPTRTGVQPL